MKTNRLIRRNEVEQLTGLRSTCIYKRMAQNEFPQSVSIGGGRVAWIESEIQQWIDDRISETRNQVAA